MLHPARWAVTFTVSALTAKYGPFRVGYESPTWCLTRKTRGKVKRWRISGTWQKVTLKVVKKYPGCWEGIYCLLRNKSHDVLKPLYVQKGFMTYLSMHAKSLERVVDQASHGLICDTASFRATSEHVKHCWEKSEENAWLRYLNGLCHSWLVHFVNRELKQQRRRPQRERQKCNRFRLAKQQLCTCIALFCTFVCRHCTRTTWKCLISRFVENVNTQDNNFIFLSLNFDAVF